MKKAALVCLSGLLATAIAMAQEADQPFFVDGIESESTPNSSPPGSQESTTQTYGVGDGINDSTFAVISWNARPLQNEGDLSLQTFTPTPRETGIFSELIESAFEKYTEGDLQRTQRMCNFFSDPANRDIGASQRALSAIGFLENQAAMAARWQNVNAQFRRDVRQELGSEFYQKLLTELGSFEHGRSSNAVSARELIERNDVDPLDVIQATCERGA
ncbi:MAG: hypothetical protein WDZ76_04990 [Pseudohongiellaceae bacterium]